MSVSTQIVTMTEKPNYPRPGLAFSFLDPYNPHEYVIKRHGKNIVGTYNMETDTYTELHTYHTYPSDIRRNYQTKEMISLDSNRFTDLGVNLEHAYGTGDGRTTLYTHSENMRKFEISYHGKIYFSTNSNQIWSLEADGSNPQMLFSTTGAAGTLATDPLDADTLVYVDGSDIKYRVLSTGVTTDVIVGNMDGNRAMVVLNGVLYTNYYHKPGVGGYIQMNLDGTNVYEYNASYTW